MPQFPRKFLAASVVAATLAVGCSLLLFVAPNEPAGPDSRNLVEQALPEGSPWPEPADARAEQPSANLAGNEAGLEARERVLSEQDFQTHYTPPRLRHRASLNPPQSAPAQYEVRNGVPTMTGGRAPLEFIAGWERPATDGSGHLERVWIVNDPNLPKYPATRIEQRIRPLSGAETVERETASVADHLVVKLRDGAEVSDLEPVLQGWGASVRNRLRLTGAYLLAFDGAEPGAMASFRKDLEQQPEVIFAEPDGHAELARYTPNDPRFDRLWGLANAGQTGGETDFDIDAPEAWNVSRGSREVIVGVIDTGIDYTHPDLAPNMWVNAGETGVDVLGQDRSRNGADDDGNGFVDDVYGYDFVNNDPDPLDEHYHGTHVAGTIGAAGDNGEGVVGVNHEVRLIALKIFHTGGRSDVTAFQSDVAESITYATLAGAKVTNNSYGGGSTSQLIEDAIADAGEAGSLFVVAAGNANRDLNSNDYWPAKYRLPNVITVAANDHEGNLASFSNFGSNFVDIGAPGVSIYSTVPTQSYPDPYGTLSGTSMACPHTAGAAALLFAADPSLSAAEVRQLIVGSVDQIDSLEGQTITGGHLNIGNAVKSLSLTVDEVVLSEDGSDGSQGNADGILNPGETLAISISLANDTDEAFTSVSATVDDRGSPLVNLVGATVAYGAISPGATASGDASFLLELTDNGLLPAVLYLPVTITSDQRTFQSTVLFEVAESRTISGAVTVDGEGAEGAEIAWRRLADPDRPERNNLPNSGTALSREDGTFDLVVPDGNYELAATFDGTTSAARTVTVPPDAAAVDFGFRSATVSGTVTSKATGEPLAGVSVVYEGAVEGEVTTNAEGVYTINATLAEADDLRLQAQPEVYTVPSWQTVTLPPSVSAVDFRLGAPAMRVSATQLSLAAAPNAEGSKSFTVTNDGDESLTFGVFNRDIELRERSSGAGRVARRFGLPAELHNSLPFWPRNYGIAHDGSALWVLNGTHNLFRISEAGGALLETIPLDLPENAVPSKLTWDGRFFWFTSYWDRSVYCYDPAKNSIIESWQFDEDEWPHYPAGITYARERIWVHRGPFLAFDFSYRFGAFLPETGEYEDGWAFAPDENRGRTHVIEFDNGTFWHAGTEHDNMFAFRGLDDPRDHPDDTTVGFVTPYFRAAMPNTYDMAATRRGAFWMIGSTNNSISDDDGHIDIALQNHTHDVWLTQSPHQVTLQPGESSTIEVRADAAKIGAGTHAATMVLRSNDPRQPEQTIDLTFEVDNGFGSNRAPTITTAASAEPAAPAWPANTVALSVVASDPDGDPLSYAWQKVSGPGEVAFSVNEAPAAASTSATFAAPGSYSLQVAVTDGNATTVDNVTVTIGASHTASGTVTKDGSAFPEAWVRFDGPTRGTVPVGGSGEYSLNLPDGTYNLQAFATGVVASETVSYNAGDPAPDFTFTTVVVGGDVFGSLSNAPAERAEVRLEWDGGENGQTADANGQFSFELVTGREANVRLLASLNGLTSAPLQLTVPGAPLTVELPIQEPDIDPYPGALDVTLAHGEVAQRALTLHNRGDGPLRWNLWPRIIGENAGRIAEAGERLVWETYEVGWPFQYLEGVAYDGTHLFLGRTGAKVIRCEPLTGRVIEVFAPSNKIGMGDMTYDATRNVIWYADNGIGSNDTVIDNVYAMRPDDGTIVETVNVPFDHVRAMDFHDGILYFAAQDGSRDPTEVIGFDLASRTEVSRIEIGTSQLITWINFHNGLLWWAQLHSSAVRFADPFDGSRIGFVNQPYGSPFHDMAMLDDGTAWGSYASDYVRWDLGTDGWLATQPSHGIIPAGESAAVAVTLDSVKTGLGTFAGALALRSNDPDEPNVEVPITLSVAEPEQSISGTVSRDGSPVAGAQVKLSGDLLSLTTTDASGQYQFAVGDGRYEVQARRE
ncbi:MAG: S8 family serine peptidase, partial [Opitutales bacterium]